MHTRIGKTALTVLVAALVLSLAGLAIDVGPAEAAGTLTDCSSYGSGAGTLQHALAGGGTVTFACSGTIVVPVITITANTPTVIDATGQNVTLTGNNANWVFVVANGSVAGYGAGAFAVAGGSLTVENSTFTGNAATGQDGRGGAIYSGGTLVITGSPAIDTGMTDLTVDQRGAPRPFGAADDIGAVELQEAQASKVHLNGLKLNWRYGAPPDIKLLPLRCVQDEFHFPLEGAEVYGERTLPDGAVVPATGLFPTDFLGRTKTRTREAQVGEYTFCVTNIVLAGYVYDPAGNDVPACTSVVLPPQ